MPEVAKCSSCGRAIIWASSPSGARLPLDARPATMYYLDDDLPPHAIAVTAQVLKGTSAGLFEGAAPVDAKVYVSHFLTCPSAADHSRARR